MVKQFFMASMGQLILARNEEQARRIVKYILTISQSQTEGVTRNGDKTHCEIYKDVLKDFLTGETSVLTDIGGSEEAGSSNATDNEEDIDNSENGWHSWAKRINSEVEALVARETGDRVNAHFLPKLANRLLNDMKQFPLWSCVTRDQFGYGRVPASSAPVESDFNDLKNRLLKSYNLPMRVDEFVAIHMDYISGRIKIADAQFLKRRQQETIDVESAENNAEPSELIPSLRNLGCEHCASGNFPDDTNKCGICGASIHLTDGCCAYRVGEQENEFVQICISCDSLSEPHLIEIISSQERENWGGEATKDEEKKGKDQKKSRYLTRDFVKNQFITDGKVRDIPILVNGHKAKKAVVVKNQTISLSNTCNFDGQFQIFLCGSFDYPSVEQIIERAAADNEFFKLVSKVRKGGVTSSTYHVRTQILLKSSSKMTNQGNNNIMIDCTTDTRAMCTLILDNLPSVREISTCDTCSEKRSSIFHLIPVDISSFTSELINHWLDDRFSFTTQNSCKTAGCSGLLTIAISEIGEFIAFEIYSVATEIPNPVQLNSIPVEIQAGCMNNKYILCGILNYHPPAVSTRRFAESNDREVGHYTAVCLRKNGTWIEYDDLKTKDRPRKCKSGSDRRTGCYEVIPDLAIYVEMPEA